MKEYMNNPNWVIGEWRGAPRGKIIDKQKKDSLSPKVVLYKDLVDIPVEDNWETLVSLDHTGLRSRYEPFGQDMAKELMDTMYVRQSVRDKLLAAQILLQQQYPDYFLYVTYGYRSLEIQKKYFDEQLDKALSKYYAPWKSKREAGSYNKPSINMETIYEEVHKMIAVPEVAWHPSWWAVDVLIVNWRGDKLDFGSPIYDFSKPIYDTFNDSISPVAKENRLLLRDVMMAQWFAPFDGEYWHFSYGDRERAFYYKQAAGLYEQINFCL